MIETKEDLKYYLERDAKNYAIQAKFSWRKIKYNLLAHPRINNGIIWKHIKALRYVEYYSNRPKPLSIFNQVCLIYFTYKLRKLSYKTGYQMAPNVIGPGLTIYHYGPIICNAKAKIGENAILNPNITIGHKVPGGPAPQIGDNVFVGSGARIIGDVHIGNNVTVAPNAVVTHDVEDNVVVGGIPAKVLRRKG